MTPRHSKLKWTLGFTLVVASLGGVSPVQAAPVNPAVVAQLQTVPAATTVSLSSSDFLRSYLHGNNPGGAVDLYSGGQEKEIEKAKKAIPNKLLKKEGRNYTDIVDLTKFGEPGKDGRRKASNGWYIEKDNAARNNREGHRGSKWKLYNRRERRVASLASDGRIVGK